jgi:hypothetical protein
MMILRHPTVEHPFHRENGTMSPTTIPVLTPNNGVAMPALGLGVVTAVARDIAEG